MIKTIKSNLVKTGEEVSVKIYISDDGVMTGLSFDMWEIPKTGFDTIEIPSEVKSISKKAFKGLIVNDNVGFGKAAEVISVRTIIVPDSVASVQDSAFSNIAADTVVWSKSCTAIPYYCFKDSRIKNFENIENVTEVGDGAFCNNPSLVSFDWPAKAKKIPDYCFSWCANLKEINGIDAVETIGQAAFNQCYSLQTFTWPETCKVVEVCCFSNCTSLTEVNFPGNVDEIKHRAFCGSAIRTIDLSASLDCKIDPDISHKRIDVYISFYLEAPEIDDSPTCSLRLLDKVGA